MKPIAAMLLAAAALVGLSGAPAQAASKDELVIGISQFPPDMHPYINATVAKSYLSMLARRPITAYNKDWEIACFLCTEVPSLENGRAKIIDLPDGKKGMAVSFTIKPDAVWGDGTPITSKDMVLSLEASKGLRPFPTILRIDPVDDKTFTIIHNTVRFDFNEITELAPLPAHLEGAVFAANSNSPIEYGKQSIYNREPTNPGLWNGPYVIKEFKNNDYVVFEPNPRWAGKKPSLKKVTIRTIENTAALEANLLSGDIDYIAGELGLTADQGLSLAKRQANRFAFVYTPTTTLEQLYLNLENPILKDKRVRQAMAYAIDRKTLTQKLFEGKTPIADSFVNPREFGYDPQTPKYTYDLKKARDMLTEAGFKPGPDGIRVNAAGQRLSFDYATTAGNRTRELIQQVVQSQFKEAGIELAIKNVPARTLFGETYTKREFMIGMSAWSSVPNTPPDRILHSAAIPSPANNRSGNNTPGFNNAEMDRLIDAGTAELDGPRRKAIWSQMQKLYIDEVPIIPLYWNIQVYALPKNLKGLVPTGHSMPSTAWIEEWSME